MGLVFIIIVAVLVTCFFFVDKYTKDLSAALAALLTVPQTVFAAPYACGDDIRIFNTGVNLGRIQVF